MASGFVSRSVTEGGGGVADSASPPSVHPPEVQVAGAAARKGLPEAAAPAAVETPTPVEAPPVTLVATPTKQAGAAVPPAVVAAPSDPQKGEDPSPVSPQESAGFRATRPEEVALEAPQAQVLEEARTRGPEWEEADVPEHPARLLSGPRRGSKGPRLAQPEAVRAPITAAQRLLLLDTWRRSGLPAQDFAALVNVSKFTLHAWKKAFDELGPAGLMDKPRGAPGGLRLPELTRRTILMLKETNPSWGCQRISDMLLRGPALPASASSVAKVLRDAGYELVDEPTERHPDKVRSFERARPNQLWQSDLFTFVLKRQNRRVYLVAFMDDHSRYLVSYGLHASQSTALVLECLRAGIASYGTPEEVLTDNGSQYITWRGKSLFSKECEKRGIRQVVASPRRPQTLGKIERFWGTLWRECLEAAVFLDLADAQTRLGHFIDYYNFQRPHQALGGLVPADRFFGAAPEVRQTLQARVAAKALDLARHGTPKPPFYLTGQVGGKPFSVHAEGERVILTRGEGARQEVSLTAPTPPPTPPAEALPLPVCPLGQVTGGVVEEGMEEPPPPGVSPLDPHFPPAEQGGEA